MDLTGKIRAEMSPSLKEKFVQWYHPDTDPTACLEDMSYAPLILKPGVKFGLWELGGEKVTLHEIDPKKESHGVTVDKYPHVPIKFKNNEDVYE